MKPKAKTRTVTERRWGWWNPATRQLAGVTALTRESADEDVIPGEVVVRLTIMYEESK